ncbi:cyclic AMP-responsive element-binding protein 5-like [Python bivittatus]|uniref:Cyclic AMP-responsive element-binding protein 5-like n=1 Tax=Python bivittatus TaxID=176946 RepID=A0A9F5IHZ7_PYTBI|nr:cyclic AMP-responsive element-binding protein 5-like [Python bivittatus]
MNLEQERPFVCSAPGCSQRFPTEDHLMIHRHKHEMTLKFPSLKTDNMLSDQTPTPTRFLKNCEEVGLFSEIDCSLEHEFRKAQEEDNSKRNLPMHNSVGGAMTAPGAHQLSNPRMPNHDTSIVIQQAMPSPQSSSVITQAPSTNRQIGIEDKLIRCNLFKPVILKVSNSLEVIKGQFLKVIRKRGLRT